MNKWIVCDESGPAISDAKGKIVTFDSEHEAQAEIASRMRDRIDDFLSGQREYDDIVWQDEPVPVTVEDDGSFTDADGNIYTAEGEEITDQT